MKLILVISILCSSAILADSFIILCDGSKHDIKSFPNQKIAEIINKDTNDNNSKKNLIFFIHGRGKHPKKALDKIIPNLEKDYDASVIMFHWFPSFTGILSRPEKSAKKSAKDLDYLFKKYKIHTDNNPNHNTKKILLIHSMGNVVFKEYIEKFHQANSLGNSLFDVIILNAADVDTKKHAKWVRNIDFTQNLYITVNNKDRVLSASAKITGKGRLGQKLKTLFHKLELASNAIYVDFTKTKVNHRYYIQGGQKNNKNIFTFYHLILNGKSAKNFLETSIKKDDGVYIFKR